MIKKITFVFLFSSLAGCASLSEKLASLAPQMPWSKSVVKVKQGAQKKDAMKQETVVLLHGLWRSKYAMNKLQDALVEDGYKVVNVGYPSYTKSLEKISEKITAEINLHVEAGEKLSFVTHSLGGIVVRDLLQKPNVWDVQRVVMLAPPNQGSEVVQMLDKYKCAWVLGPVSDSLLCDSVKQMPASLPKDIELGVIMGTDSGLTIFNKVLADKNDGIVTVEGGKMAGMKEFQTSDNNHTFIMIDDKVISATVNFLAKGSFDMVKGSK